MLGAYGTGANPRISGSSNTINTGVEFDHTHQSNGWKISGVDFHDQKIAAIDAETGARVANKGLWIENSVIDNVTGATVIAANFPACSGAACANFPNAGYNVYYSVAIDTWRFDHVTVNSVTVTNSDAALQVYGANTVSVDTFTSDHTYRAGLLFADIPVNGAWGGTNPPEVFQFGDPQHVPTTNVTLSNFLITYAGYRDGMWWGTTGLQFSGVRNATVGPGEISFTQMPNASPDGVGFDVEGETEGIHLDSLNVHDCTGAGALIFNHQWDKPADLQLDTRVTNSTFTNNGTNSPTTLPVFGRWVSNNSNNAVITGNTFNKSGHVGQSVDNWLGQTGNNPNGSTDTFPPRFTVSGNTINP